MKKMPTVRKLQHIGKQHLLNVPASFVKWSGWQKGDYLEIAELGQGNFNVRKIAENNAGRADVVLTSLEQEAAGLYAIIQAASDKMSSGEYAARFSRLHHVTAKIRKLKQKISGQSIPRAV